MTAAVPEHGSRFGYFLTGYGILVFLSLLVPLDADWFDLLRMLAILAGIPLWGLWRFMQGFREARLIEDTPTSRIRSAAQGYVELVGTAQGTPGICAVGGLPALWCDYSVTERKPFEKGIKTVARHFGEEPFQLRDEHGDVCLIHPARAQVVTQEYVWHASTPTPDHVPGPAVRWLSRLFCGLVHWLPAAAVFPVFLLAFWLIDSFLHVGMSGFGTLFVLLWTGAFFMGRYRCRLRLIRADDRIYALGHFSSDAPDAKGRAVHSLRVPPTSDRPYLLSTLAPEELASQRRRQALPFIAVFVLGSALLFLVFPVVRDYGKPSASVAGTQQAPVPAPQPEPAAFSAGTAAAPVAAVAMTPAEESATGTGLTAADDAPPAGECTLDGAPSPHLRCGPWSWILPRADNAAWPAASLWHVSATPATRVEANGAAIECFEARAEGRLPGGEPGSWPALVLVRHIGPDQAPDAAAIYDADASCLSVEMAGDAFRLRLSEALRRALGREFADLKWSSIQ